jgi:Fic family protein
MLGQRGAGSDGTAPFSVPEDEQAIDAAKLEVDNGFRQIDLGIDVIKMFLEPDRPFALRPSLIQQLQKVAVEGIVPYPGEWRTGPATITKSSHVPPGPHLVNFLVQEMCDYVNDNWHEKTAFHLSAYVMWRLNWIHPFPDGNGRTSRVASYIVLCNALNALLPGSPSILQQIQDDRTTYFHALEHADSRAAAGQIDVSEMESVLRNMLAKQLLSVIEQAGGGTLGAADS